MLFNVCLYLNFNKTFCEWLNCLFIPNLFTHVVIFLLKYVIYQFYINIFLYLYLETRNAHFWHTYISNILIKTKHYWNAITVHSQEFHVLCKFPHIHLHRHSYSFWTEIQQRNFSNLNSLSVSYIYFSSSTFRDREILQFHETSRITV